MPSANYVPIWIEKGLVVELDQAKLPHHANIAPEWMDVAYDPGRKYSIPWQWGTTGVAVNTSVYGGDVNTSAVFLDVPAELKGKINVVPEMMDIIGLATMYHGGELCSEDLEVLKKVRDSLTAAKSSGEMSIAEAGKEIRYFVIVRSFGSSSRISVPSRRPGFAGRTTARAPRQLSAPLSAALFE